MTKTETLAIAAHARARIAAGADPMGLAHAVVYPEPGCEDLAGVSTPLPADADLMSAGYTSVYRTLAFWASLAG